MSSVAENLKRTIIKSFKRLKQKFARKNGRTVYAKVGIRKGILITRGNDKWQVCSESTLNPTQTNADNYQ